MQFADGLISREISLLKRDFFGSLGAKKKTKVLLELKQAETRGALWMLVLGLLWVGSKPAYNF